jgi:diguanylate cyclase (GGDEF)-like protein
VSTKLNILLAEDDEDDFIITRRMLEDAYGSRFRLQWVRDWEHALAAIDQKCHDVCLVDYRLGARDGVELIVEARRKGSEVPIILLTGQGDREVDMAALAAGASDYLIKNELSTPLLERAIRYAMERARNERHLASMALRDPLTGLGNRSFFSNRLESDIRDAKRAECGVAVLLIDLDNFKDVNDTLGHPAGDALLRQVASRLLQNVRETDTVARLGGDEFAIIATHLAEPERGSTLARKFQEAFERPFEIEKQQILVTISIGISLFPTDARSADRLLNSADLALYAVKERGRNGFRFFDHHINSAARNRRTMEEEIRAAISKRQFRLFFQPRFDVENGQLVAVEALLRWQHPERGCVHPAEFIRVAESSGLIMPLGEWVLEEACRQCAEWTGSGLFDGVMAINLSAVQLKQQNFLEALTSALERSQVPPSSMEFEIAEAVVMERSGAMPITLERIHELGVRLIIDNFGSGSTSLARLARAPVDALKIDRSFVRDVDQNAKSAGIVEAVIHLAKSLGLDVRAEGVERVGQRRFLQARGCTHLQGHYFAPAVPATAIESMLAEQARGQLLSVVEQH